MQMQQKNVARAQPFLPKSHGQYAPLTPCPISPEGAPVSVENPDFPVRAKQRSKQPKNPQMDTGPKPTPLFAPGAPPIALKIRVFQRARHARQCPREDPARRETNQRPPGAATPPSNISRMWPPSPNPPTGPPRKRPRQPPTLAHARLSPARWRYYGLAVAREHTRPCVGAPPSASRRPPVGLFNRG